MTKTKSTTKSTKTRTWRHRAGTIPPDALAILWVKLGMAPLAQAVAK